MRRYTQRRVRPVEKELLKLHRWRIVAFRAKHDQRTVVLRITREEHKTCI